MPIEKVRRFHCPLCDYIKYLRDDEDEKDYEPCPACGSGTWVKGWVKKIDRVELIKGEE